MGTNDYVGYELAVKLKACGFDEPCDHYYEATHWERTACFPLKRKEPERYKAYKALVKEPPEINLREEYGITNSVFVSREDVINLTQNDGVIRRSVFASAPTLAHAQKCLREKWGIAINVIAHDGGRYHTERIVLPNCTIPESRDWYVETTTPMVYSYEQALSAGLAAALELIKKGG